MKIKIVEPSRLDPRYDVSTPLPGLGPVVVATLLKRAGHDVEVLSEYVRPLEASALAGADLVGISITTFNAVRGYQIAAGVCAPVVFGGYHASLLPAECLEHGDFVIRGDGQGVVELAARLEGGSHHDLGSVRNLVYRVGTTIIENPCTPGTPDIVPDFTLVRGLGAWSARRLLRVPLLVNASRGCPHSCSFCAIKAVHADVSRKSVDVVLADIAARTRQSRRTLARFLPRSIWVTDDNFFADPVWAKQLLAGIARLRTGYPIMIQARADVADDDELLALMRAAGVARVYLGIETVDQAGLDAFRKGTTLDAIVGAVGKIRARGMDVHGLFVLGGEEFRRGDGARVAAFVRRHRLDGALVQPLTPFPGTPLFRQLRSQGRLLHERWQEYNGKVVFRPRHLTPAELQREVGDCYDEVYSVGQVAKWLCSGTRTAKLLVLGDAVMRRLEARRVRRYARERLGGAGVGTPAKFDREKR